MRRIFRRIRDRFLGILRLEIAEHRQFTQGHLERIENFLDNHTALLNQQTIVLERLGSKLQLLEILARPAGMIGQPDITAVGVTGDATPVTDTAPAFAAILDRMAEVSTALEDLRSERGRDMLLARLPASGAGEPLVSDATTLTSLVEMQAGAIDGLTVILQDVRSQFESMTAVVAAANVDTMKSRIDTLFGHVSNVENALSNIATLVSEQHRSLAIVDAIKASLDTKVDFAGSVASIEGIQTSLATLASEQRQSRTAIDGIKAWADTWPATGTTANDMDAAPANTDHLAGMIESQGGTIDGIVVLLQDVRSSLESSARATDDSNAHLLSERVETLTGHVANVENALSNIGALVSEQHRSLAIVDEIKSTLQEKYDFASSVASIEGIQTSLATVVSEQRQSKTAIDGIKAWADTWPATGTTANDMDAAPANTDRLAGMIESQGGTIDGIAVLLQEVRSNLEGSARTTDDSDAHLLSDRVETLIGHVANVENALSNIATLVSEQHRSLAIVDEIRASLDAKADFAVSNAKSFDGIDAAIQGVRSILEEGVRVRPDGSLGTLKSRVETLFGHVANVENGMNNIASLVSQQHAATLGRPSDSATAGRQFLAINAMVERLRRPLESRGSEARGSSYHPAKPRPFDAYVAAMEKLGPNAFPIWAKLFRNSEMSYTSDPVASCSTWGNLYAEAFRDFCSLYLQGRVLDIGCGPNGRPLYLNGYPSNCISVIEPLPMRTKVDFEVVRGFAEFLPWPVGSFHTVIASSSLDHTLSLEKALSEVHSMLVPGGSFLVWIASIPGAPRYNPSALHLQAFDEFHLFHIDAAWFEPMMSGRFAIAEKLTFPAGSYDHVFYRFVKISGEDTVSQAARTGRTGQPALG